MNYEHIFTGIVIASNDPYDTLLDKRVFLSPFRGWTKDPDGPESEYVQHVKPEHVEKISTDNYITALEYLEAVLFRPLAHFQNMLL